MSSLTFTKKKAPAYKDRFCRVQEMIEYCNHHMSENFNPSWASCWTNLCPSGSTSLLAQDGCSVLESPIHMVMNIIQLL